MKLHTRYRHAVVSLLGATATLLFALPASSQDKPNIVMIMGDDVGWFNIGAYHQGMMSGKTPNIDALAREGVRFTDYYAEASCTAGRASFITGQIPMRTGLTTVGQAGADVGMPAAAPTTATALKAMGYATGQFGKNHLGDRNKFLPTLHGFDEFYGYLYHLDAMSDPYWHSYPKELAQKIGPRNVLHCWASDRDDPATQPRWGTVGMQKVEDDGPLSPERMKTFDDEVLEKTFAFIDKAHQAGKPFFVWLNPTRMHIFTHLDDRYEALMTSESNYGLYEAGMAQFDDIVGAVVKKLEDLGVADNTIIGVTSDNGAETFTWPDGGSTPFRGGKGEVYEGGFRVPMIARWPGKIRPGTVENGMMSGLDWFPTLVAAAGNSNIGEELKQGKQLGDKRYKVHLDGFNQMDMLLGNGPSKRREFFYFVESDLGAVRIDHFKFLFIEQPEGWPGQKVRVNMPRIVNLRQDPFERTPQTDWGVGSADYMMSFFAREFWRFVFVQERVAALAKTALEFPPMQRPASFNMTAVKERIQAAIESQSGR